MVEELECQEATDKGDTNSPAPEANIAVHEVHEGVVHQEGKAVSTPSSNDESSKLNNLHEEASNDKSEEDRASKDNPSDPLLGIFIEESGVEDDPHQGNTQQNSSYEDHRFE